jgi:hypothetical protein
MISDHLQIISAKFIQNQQIFDPSQTLAVSGKCREDSRIFVESLKKLELWALNCKLIWNILYYSKVPGVSILYCSNVPGVSIFYCSKVPGVSILYHSKVPGVSFLYHSKVPGVSFFIIQKYQASSFFIQKYQTSPSPIRRISINPLFIPVHDATAKLSSGILNGNINQYGDFDQCLNTAAPEKSFQGKYCLAHLQPKSIKSNQYLEQLRWTIHAKEVFKSRFEDVSNYG